MSSKLDRAISCGVTLSSSSSLSLLLDDSKVISGLLSSADVTGGGAIVVCTAILVGVAGAATAVLLATDGRTELKSDGVTFEKLDKLWGGLDTNSAGDNNFCELKLKLPIGPVNVIVLVVVRELKGDDINVVRDGGSTLLSRENPLLISSPDAPPPAEWLTVRSCK